ncbi:MAG: tRNA guanosine(15) transglycosylase TgtA [Thermoplasmata archaeon]
MTGFELLERDGFARLGRFSTPHGVVDTPALLPVVHPDPTRQPIPPREMQEKFGIRAVITSAYITWRTPPLRAAAEANGIHGFLRFDGSVMTDSGAFQQHAYGSVEVGPEEILDFQNRIGSDIATVLDIFGEPSEDHAQAAAGVRVTEEHAVQARAMRTGLLAVPVQGGTFDDLRAESARSATERGDVLAVGGVVPLMEHYRFAELAAVLLATRPYLGPERIVHLFGTGHPMTFAFAALFGVDLFDSSAYHKFARRGDLLFPEGTIALEGIKEPICHCRLCAELPLNDVGALPPEPREAWIARHNLLTSVEEVARVRQAIRDGNLWELAERRAAAHPALRVGLNAVLDHSDAFLAVEPESRRVFREVGASSLRRPAVLRFRQKVDAWQHQTALARRISRLPLHMDYLAQVPPKTTSGASIGWECETELGPVPLEFLEMYPVGPYLGAREFEVRDRLPTPTELRRSIESEYSDLAAADDWTADWDARQMRALLAWEYGVDVADALLRQGVRAVRSRRTGRLRGIRLEGDPLFVIGNDSIPRPTWSGARLVQPLLAAPGHRVVVSDDGAPFVASGRTLFARFVQAADPSLVPESSALLVDSHDSLLAVGRLLMAPHEMGRFQRGIVAYITSHARRSVAILEEEGDPALRIPPQARDSDLP